MQTAPKTPRIKFAVRVLAVILCLAIGLFGVVIPARGAPDPVQVEFQKIAVLLAAEGIDSNIGDVTMSTVGSFPNLYFEKWTTIGDPATAIGKIIFSTPVNFTDTATTDFLKSLGEKMKMERGLIALDVSTSAAFQEHGATLVMYNLPPGRTIADLTVSADDGTPIPTDEVVTGFTQDSVTNNVSINATHFTKFEINTTRTTFQIYLPLVIR